MEKPLKYAFGLTILGVATLLLTFFAIIERATASQVTGTTPSVVIPNFFSAITTILLISAIVLELRLFRSADVGRRIGLSILASLQLGIAVFAVLLLYIGVNG